METKKPLEVGTSASLGASDRLGSDGRNEDARFFADALPKYLLATDSFASHRRREQSEALNFKYIQLNLAQRKIALLFDIDRAGAAFAHEDASLPTPTVIVVNPENGHAHMIYLLRVPVFFDARHRDLAKHRPYLLLELIRIAYREALGADRAYPGLLVKNPLHPAWRALWSNRTYNLDELVDGYPRDIPPRKRHRSRRARDESEAVADDEIILEGRRNKTLFDRGRTFAYDAVPNSLTESHLQTAVSEFCRTQNSNFRPPLPQSEVSNTTRSIASWVWRNRDKFRKQRRQPQDPNVTLTNRQKGVATARRLRTQKLIAKLFDRLQSAGSHYSISSLSRRTGMDRKTVRRLLPIAMAVMPLRRGHIPDRRDLSPQGQRRLESVGQRVGGRGASDFRTTVNVVLKDLRRSSEGTLEGGFVDNRPRSHVPRSIQRDSGLSISPAGTHE